MHLFWAICNHFKQTEKHGSLQALYVYFVNLAISSSWSSMHLNFLLHLAIISSSIPTWSNLQSFWGSCTYFEWLVIISTSMCQSWNIYNHLKLLLLFPADINNDNYNFYSYGYTTVILCYSPLTIQCIWIYNCRVMLPGYF